MHTQPIYGICMWVRVEEREGQREILRYEERIGKTNDGDRVREI